MTRWKKSATFDVIDAVNKAPISTSELHSFSTHFKDGIIEMGEADCYRWLVHNAHIHAWLKATIIFFPFLLWWCLFWALQHRQRDGTQCRQPICSLWIFFWCFYSYASSISMVNRKIYRRFIKGLLKIIVSPRWLLTYIQTNKAPPVCLGACVCVHVSLWMCELLLKYWLHIVYLYSIFTKTT